MSARPQEDTWKRERCMNEMIPCAYFSYPPLDEVAKQSSLIMCYAATAVRTHVPF